MVTKEELTSKNKPTWCPGCGNHLIWFCLKQALEQLGYPQEEYVIVYGIGCCSNMCNTLNVYGFEGLHGRGIPVAEGVKLANPKLKVIVIAGDGDTYGEGLNHFITGVRGNHDVTLIVHDNRVYGLTTGQASPTSQKGYKAKSTPAGTIELPVNPAALALAAGGSFVARGFSADPQHLTALLVEAIKHRGFSAVNVFQNCATFNKVNDVVWFKNHTYHAEHDPTDKMAAFTVALDEEKLATGILYQDKREAYDEDLPVDGVVETSLDVDIADLMDELT